MIRPDIVSVRSFRGGMDLPLIANFLNCLPSTSRHLVDFPWRLSALAASLDPILGLWEQVDGALVALAAWQPYWQTVDLLLDPRASVQETAMFEWVAQQLGARNPLLHHPERINLEVYDQEKTQQERLQRSGWILSEEHTLLQMSHELAELPTNSSIPDGFSLRSLRGEEDIPAYTELYQAAFASSTMTDAWRQWTLQMPSYTEALDLVMVAPDHTLAGCCLGWFDARRCLGQVEPVGVHPRFQRLGIARALVQELLRRFQAQGVQAVLIEPEEANTGACKLYQSLGWKPVQRILHAGKSVSPVVSSFLEKQKPMQSIGKKGQERSEF